MAFLTPLTEHLSVILLPAEARMDGLPSIASVGTENMSKYNDISHIREVPHFDPVDSTHSTHKHFYWKFF